MREPERIKRVLTLIEKIWSRTPDIRFNQLIDNLQYEYVSEVESKLIKTVYKENNFEVNGIVISELIKSEIPDLFYLEDDEFERFLIDYLCKRKVGE